MSQPEQPWVPGPNDIPWGTCFFNPHGERHLAFNEHEGRFYRLWQCQPPEPLHTGDAILLRPSDIDQIIKWAMIWVVKHSNDPRGYELVDEIAAGAKALVVHFAGVPREFLPAVRGRRRSTP